MTESTRQLVARLSHALSTATGGTERLRATRGAKVVRQWLAEQA